MAIKDHLEQAARNLEAEKEREENIIKEKVTREKIVPYNQDADKGRDLAIAELQQELNADIAKRQAKFEEDKKAIIDENEKRKNNNATAVIASETYPVTCKYDKAICHLKDQIKALTE